MNATTGPLLAVAASTREAAVWLIAAALLTLSLWQALPSGDRPGRWRRRLIVVSGLLGLGLLWWQLPRLGSLALEIEFGVLATLAVMSAVATIATRNAVYCAIWFAVTLLATGGLMLIQGAQFVGLATVAVYAGAIVVTFLFVLMLAQPAGHTFYDRIGWGTASRFIGAVTATLFTILMAMSIMRPAAALADRRAELQELQAAIAAQAPEAQIRALRYETIAARKRAVVSVAIGSAHDPSLPERIVAWQPAVLDVLSRRHPDWHIASVRFDFDDVQVRQHTAHLGGQLFGRHLITIQAGGTLLLAALVGVVAIVTRGQMIDQDKSEHHHE
jgi:NADH-quinone oxidoreductase subunit J